MTKVLIELGLRPAKNDDNDTLIDPKVVDDEMEVKKMRKVQLVLESENIRNKRKTDPKPQEHYQEEE